MQVGIAEVDLRREVTTRIRRVTGFLEAFRNAFLVVAEFLGVSRSRRKQHQARGNEEGLHRASSLHGFSRVIG